MKTIIGLEKEIEKLKEQLKSKGSHALFDYRIRVKEEVLEQTKSICNKIQKSKVISENSYGEEDGTDDIKLVKYLIDREELLKRIKGLDLNEVQT